MYNHGEVTEEPLGVTPAPTHTAMPSHPILQRPCAVKAPNAPETYITGASSCLTVGTHFKPDGGCSSTMHLHLHLEIWTRTWATGKAAEGESRAKAGRIPGACLCLPRDLNRR